MHSSQLAALSQLSIWQVWWLAIRPKTLPAALSSVIVACGLSWHDGVFRLGPALAAMAVALLLQIGSNLANDVFDYERGVDTEERKGPMRVTQAGLLAPGQVRLGMKMVFFVAFMLWLYLAWASSWYMILVGLLAILAAITYTGGPFPFGAYGLGDPFVFLFFGPVAVMGAYFVQALQVSAAAWWMSVAMGLIITAILVVNNLRDIPTDSAAGRKTLAVRFGPTWARREYFCCLIIAYALVPALIWAGLLPLQALLSWGSLVVVWPTWRLVEEQEGEVLNIALAGTGKIAMSYSLLFAVGLILAAL
ncbi:MAG: 1,4-dihydroxy-2-naphthoate polyprenyltransferase [Desulfobulbaceae bacterium]|nr:1,4-dihydroxy-2-naphthoate polyprenyltransferase [Desulfobulbaceae bacterium]